MRRTILQARIVTTDNDAQTLIAELERYARTLLGDDVIYRTQTRHGDRAGYSRVYLTATRNEDRL